MSRLARTLAAVVGALALLASSSACTGGDPAGPDPSAVVSPSVSVEPTLPPIGSGCLEMARQGHTVHLTNNAGHTLAAVDLGSGPAGVVLAHQSDANMCQWLPYATTLAGRGYRVVVFDFAGFGDSSPAKPKTYLDDIRTVVDYLRAQGTQQVVLVGASMGATMSVVATAAITPPLAGLVALSPPTTFDGINAERAAPSLHTPALYVAGSDDGDYSVYARQINQATPTQYRNLLLVDAPQHGVELVGATSSAGEKVRAALEKFLSDNLRSLPSTSPTR
jgi:pimeloyl-ACP methyl ester carboxylesterase